MADYDFVVLTTFHTGGERFPTGTRIKVVSKVNPGPVIRNIATGATVVVETPQWESLRRDGFLMPRATVTLTPEAKEKAKKSRATATADTVVTTLRKRPNLLAEVISVLAEVLVVGPWLPADDGVEGAWKRWAAGTRDGIRSFSVLMVYPGRNDVWWWVNELHQNGKHYRVNTKQEAMDAADTNLADHFDVVFHTWDGP
jgi:hypothetical protein